MLSLELFWALEVERSQELTQILRSIEYLVVSNFFFPFSFNHNLLNFLPLLLLLVASIYSLLKSFDYTSHILLSLVLFLLFRREKFQAGYYLIGLRAKERENSGRFELRDLIQSRLHFALRMLAVKIVKRVFYV